MKILLAFFSPSLATETELKRILEHFEDGAITPGTMDSRVFRGLIKNWVNQRAIFDSVREVGNFAEPLDIPTFMVRRYSVLYTSRYYILVDYILFF